MIFSRTIVFGLMVMMLSVSGVYADDKDGDDMHKNMKGDRHMMLEEHHQMTQDVMSMLKSTMLILRDLNHKPSDAEREMLSKMVADLDRMMDKHNKMAEQAREMYRKRMEMHDEDHEEMEGMRERRKEKLKNYTDN